jgi:hypothetical protein
VSGDPEPLISPVTAVTAATWGADTRQVQHRSAKR